MQAVGTGPKKKVVGPLHDEAKRGQLGVVARGIMGLCGKEDSEDPYVEVAALTIAEFMWAVTSFLTKK